MFETERTRRRREIQRGLMIDLFDMTTRADVLDRDLAAWRKRWLDSYKNFDDAIDTAEE